MSVMHLDVVATRGGLVESTHRVHAAVVRADGSLLHTARNPDLVTHWRSCAKPFQVIPLVENGAFDRLGWGDEQLALACASHGGEPEHVLTCSRMIESLGLDEKDLACGPHTPLSARGAKLLRESGSKPTRLHNNCSGKHSAMLARARSMSWPTEGYQNVEHPVQQGCLQSVARWTGIDANHIGCAVDGCGCTVFALPLTAMATAFARLVSEARDGSEVPARIVKAMTAHPFLVGGSDRFDTILMEVTDGRVIAKIGAEAVHSFAIVDQGIGIALKAEDGAQRAQLLAVVTILQKLRALPAELPARLREILSLDIRNTRGEIVGEVRLANVS